MIMFRQNIVLERIIEAMTCTDLNISRHMFPFNKYHRFMGKKNHHFIYLFSIVGV